MALTVNLDALIKRADFEISAPKMVAVSTRNSTEWPTSVLADTYPALRKPDFQRETSGWTPQNVVRFVQSFIDGDVIPAIIVWRSPKTGIVFVIDGAHRLSALLAWMNDDYGAGTISRAFYRDTMEPDQVKAHDQTKKLVADTIGTYRDLAHFMRNPGSAPTDDKIRWANNLSHMPLFVQWVVGEPSVAEASFLRINNGAVSISKTERLLIAARKHPNAIGTRALMRAGTGDGYFWSAFSNEAQNEIEHLAKDIYGHLFRPVSEYPPTTAELPAAGNGYSGEAMKTVFDLVNFIARPSSANDHPPPTNTEDKDGTATVAVLKRVHRATLQVFSKDPSSLGLHPAVYCYGATGLFIPKAFIAAVLFSRDLAERKQFPKFTLARERLEDFLHKHRYFLNQVSADKGGGTKGLPTLLRFYDFLLTKISAKATDAEIIAALRRNDELSFLYVPPETKLPRGGRISKYQQAAVVLREGMDAALRCKLCGARVSPFSATFDHIEKKAKGGSGAAANARRLHPYCNSARDALEPLFKQARRK